MAKQPRKPTSSETKERDRQIRAKYQHRPDLEELVASGDATAPMKQGEYLTLMQFAAALKNLRQQMQLSLADLAERSGIDRAAISRLENGLVENPTLGTLSRLARSLGKRIRIEFDDEPVGASR